MTDAVVPAAVPATVTTVATGLLSARHGAVHA
jgi:hypothetical protein